MEWANETECEISCLQQLLHLVSTAAAKYSVAVSFHVGFTPTFLIYEK